MGSDLSPAGWPKAERERFEQLESITVSPIEARSVEGNGGIISATVSPLSVYAGIQTLFVRIVRREGGNVTADDLKRYEPVWSEPCKETVFGHTVYVNGPPHLGVQSLFTGLNLAEALQLDRQGPYWSDPATFQALARIEPVATVAPAVGRRTMDLLKAAGVDISPDAQLGKAYARALAPLLSNVGMSVIERPAWQLPVPVPSDGYSPEFREKLKSLGLVLSDVPSAAVSSLRSTLAAVSIDPKTGRRTAVDQPGIYVFNRAE
jgi:hypothetical protein